MESSSQVKRENVAPVEFHAWNYILSTRWSHLMSRTSLSERSIHHWVLQYPHFECILSKKVPVFSSTHDNALFSQEYFSLACMYSIRSVVTHVYSGSLWLQMNPKVPAISTFLSVSGYYCIDTILFSDRNVARDEDGSSLHQLKRWSSCK